MAGPNVENIGARRLYQIVEAVTSEISFDAPELVRERLGAEQGIIVTLGVVAGVSHVERLDAFETETVQVSCYSAVSSELLPVAIVAAHMGLRIAAAVVTTGGSRDEEMGSGRS